MMGGHSSRTPTFQILAKGLFTTCKLEGWTGNIWLHTDWVQRGPCTIINDSHIFSYLAWCICAKWMAVWGPRRLFTAKKSSHDPNPPNSTQVYGHGIVHVSVEMYIGINKCLSCTKKIIYKIWIFLYHWWPINTCELFIAERKAVAVSLTSVLSRVTSIDPLAIGDSISIFTPSAWWISASWVKFFIHLVLTSLLLSFSVGKFASKTTRTPCKTQGR